MDKTCSGPDISWVRAAVWMAAVALGVTAAPATGWADAPIAQAGSATTNENVPVEVTLRAEDADGDSVTFSITDNPDHGTLSCDFRSGCTSIHAFNYDNTADIDNGSCQFTSCRQIKLNNPNATSGNYTIDPDGTGSVGALTAFCDMTTDGGGYTLVPVNSGIRTYRSTDNNTCKTLGMDIAVPRTKEHFRTMISRYGTSYFAIVPGVSKGSNGGNYTGFAMKSGSVPDWQAVDGGNWFLRDSPFSEPNGDYTANCWLNMYHWDVNDLRFNDGSCSYSANRYLCSTNDKQGEENLSNLPSSCAEIKANNPGATSGNHTIRTQTGHTLTVYCDMTTDGGGYDYYPINSGIRTYRSTDNNSCKALGMDIAVPRTKAHWSSMLGRYGTSYFTTVPGISKPSSGGNYTGFAMKSGSVPDWRAVDGGNWFLRDSPFSEPNGDYTANCWLSMYNHDVNNIQFNDGSCSYSTTRYLCSTNAKDGQVQPDTSNKRSCLEIKRDNPNATSGNYEISPTPGVTVTAYCDMTTDGGGYTHVAIDNGQRTYRSSDDNSCKALGMDIVIPRTKAHWSSLFSRFGTSYFSTVPGITKPLNGGNYSGWAMSSISGVPDWRATDGGSWFLRDTRYSEPSGDYTANCWMALSTHDPNDLRFNDGGCSYSTTRYVCSTNDKDGAFHPTLPASCAEIKRDNPGAASGNYTILTSTNRQLTVFCDMTTDGGGYDYYPISSGRRTYRTSDPDSCKDLGLQMAVPRTKAHWSAMLGRYGTSFMTVAPGIFNRFNGGNYTGFAMKSGSVPNWQAIDGGSWFLRDSPFSEPSGDYVHGCWMLVYDWNPDNIRFNDGNCSYSATRYICSTNAKDGPVEPPTSCLEILKKDPTATSGYYDINPGRGTVRAYCDMTTDGGGYTLFPIANGKRSFRATDESTCKDLGMDMAVPRTKAHWTSMLNVFGSSYLTIAPGISKPHNGGNYTGFAMKHGAVPDWQAVDGGSWFLRDSPYSEPSGDYTENCWMAVFNQDPNNIQFNDGNCSYSATRYLCSTNDKDPHPDFNDVSDAPDPPARTEKVCTYTPQNNYAGTDVFTFRTTDASGLSDTANFNLTIIGVNDAPTANNQGTSTNEDTPRSITLTGTDIDGDDLTYIVVGQPSNGALNCTGASCTYTPTANFNGNDSFTFKVNDGTVDSGNATVSITVNPVNDAPVANDQNVVTDEDTPRAITLTGSDIDGNALTYSVVGQPSNGAVTCTGASCTYTPTANFNGNDSFTFKANDGTADSANATVNITVSPVNDAPVANNATALVSEDGSVSITLTGTDADGNGLTYSVVGQPSNGALNCTGASCTYTPTANFNGNDSFTFKVNDGTVDAGNATVNITVNAVNDAPVANAQSVSTNEDTDLAITLTGTDIDNDALTFQILTQPQRGTLNCTGADCTYSPTANTTGPDSFLFRVNDGTANSGTVTVNITVNDVNDTPVANAQSVSTNEDTAIVITLTATDADGDTLTYSAVGQPSNGALNCTGASCTYTPTANFNGNDSFTFKVNDGTVDSANATVNITVNPINDAPTTDNQSVATNEDTNLSIILGANDVDNDDLTYSVVGQPSNGALNCTGASCTYTPTANFNGNDSFTFKVNDGTVDSGNATVSITVNAVNDAPVANDQNVVTDEDTPRAITLGATDGDNDPLTYTIVAVPTRGALNCTDANCTYTPNGNTHGSDRVRFQVNDGTTDSGVATVNITVNPVNDAPVTADRSVDTTRDAPVTLTLTASDVDGDDLTFSVITDPDNGELSGAAPNLTYTPDNGFIGADTFTVQVSDGTATDTATITVRVLDNTLDPPAVSAITQSRWLGAGTRFEARVTDSDCQTPPTLGVSPNTLALTVTDHNDGGWTVASQILGEGTYPVTLTATSTCSSKVGRDEVSFGIDTTAGTFTFTGFPQNGVDPFEPDTWPIISTFDEAPMAMLLRDTRSGVSTATATLFELDDNNASTTLHTETAPTSGTPPVGPTIRAATMCTDDDLCSGGKLLAIGLTGNRFLIRLQLTDVAGNTLTQDHYFRVATLRPSVVLWRSVLDGLSSNIPAADAAREDAIDSLDNALLSLDEGYFGNFILALEDAATRASLAKILDANLDTDSSALLVALLASNFFEDHAQAARDEHNDSFPVRTAFDFIERARDNVQAGSPRDAFLALANTWFWTVEADEEVGNQNFATTLDFIERINGQIDDYIDNDPELVGLEDTIDGRNELEDVQDFIEQVVDEGDRSLSDLEHVQLLLGLTNTAEALKAAQQDGTWVRNWQWGLTQIVYIYAERGINNAATFLSDGNPLIQAGRAQLAASDTFRQEAKADDFMQLLIDSRCLILGIYNLAYEPDEDIPAVCCEDIIEYNGLDSRVPVPRHCR